MNWNIFSALLVLSICHLSLVIETWFQGWPARQTDLFFFCASVLTACQHLSPAESERMEEGDQVEADTGGLGTSTISNVLRCFYSPLPSSQRDHDRYGCSAGFLVSISNHFAFLFCKFELKMNSPQISFSVSLLRLMCKKENEDQCSSYLTSAYSSRLWCRVETGSLQSRRRRKEEELERNEILLRG